jgi:glutamine amidotransferase
MKIKIIDTGNANFLSLYRAIKLFESNVEISSDPREILEADKIFLPGVGAFKNCIHNLKQKGIFDILKKIDKEQIPIMGICLGMQILFNDSNEFGESEGLGLVQGNIRNLENINLEKNFKIPSIGWIQTVSNIGYENISNIIEDKFYFIHSYYAVNIDEKNLVSYYYLNKNKIPAIIKKNNIVGCQFHPEKSSKQGLNLIKAFLEGNL